MGYHLQERKKSQSQQRRIRLRLSLALALTALALVNIQDDLTPADLAPDSQVLCPGSGVNAQESVISAADGTNQEPIFDCV